MHDQPDLFGGVESPSPPEAERLAAPIADWQVGRLRAALDATGLTSMAERQAKVVEVVGRPVESLRELSADEANLAISRLAATRTSRSEGSAWDERDDDTWIDRL